MRIGAHTGLRRQGACASFKAEDFTAGRQNCSAEPVALNTDLNIGDSSRALVLTDTSEGASNAPPPPTAGTANGFTIFKSVFETVSDSNLRTAAGPARN